MDDTANITMVITPVTSVEEEAASAVVDGTITAATEHTAVAEMSMAMVHEAEVLHHHHSHST